MIPALKVLVGVVCGYEAIAISSRNRLPTVSQLCGRHPYLKPVVVGGLTYHLYRKVSR